MRYTIPDKINNKILRSIDSQELVNILDLCDVVDLDYRQTLMYTGGIIDHLYFIETGIVSIVKIMMNGETSEVGLVGFEGMVGVSALLGRHRSEWHAIVQMTGLAFRMPAEIGKEAFSGYPGFRTSTLRFVGHYLDLVSQTAACNRLHSAPRRCCRWLLIASRRAQSDHIPMTQEFLAAMLGVRRTGVSTIAAELQRLGLIEYRRGSVTILDREGLEAGACECAILDRQRFAAIS